MYNHKVLNNVSESIYAGNSTAVNNLPSWLLKSDFSRNNTDLIVVSSDGDKLMLISWSHIDQQLSGNSDTNTPPR